MFADNEVLLQLGLEGLHRRLEVGEASVLGGEGHRLHGLKLGPCVSEERNNNDQLEN